MIEEKIINCLLNEGGKELGFEILEKQTTHTVSVNAGTDVLGAKVGYTN